MKELGENCADLIFTCPPFWNIETYEDVEGELSHYRTYNEFLERIQIAGANCYRILKPGGFCVWVVADFRKDGFKVFHRDVLDIFEKSGLHMGHSHKRASQPVRMDSGREM